MNSNEQRLHYLFKKYLQDNGTPDELKEFWNLFSDLDGQGDSVKKELWEVWFRMDDANNQKQNRDWDNILKEIHTRAGKWEEKQTPLVLMSTFRHIAAAAIIILLLGAGTYFLFSGRFSKSNVQPLAKAPTAKNDVSAGGNKAILTLSNGSNINLNNAPDGNLAQQGSTQIIKLGYGQLSYKKDTIAYNEERNKEMIRHNTLTTPRGGQYRVQLSDGTLVWLNSASSINYPTSFTGKKREVEITGEAYFEVAHNPSQPFIVSVNGTQVEVLGTHFNINAYNDEPYMTTTLLEGSIKLTTASITQLLFPKQQFQVLPKGKTKLLRDVDVEQVIAWKNGEFSFHNTSIYEVMRQLSRWYDVDVVFKEPLDVYLNGTIQKDVNVSQVFKMIGLTGEAKFKIEGRKITVTK